MSSPEKIVILATQNDLTGAKERTNEINSNFEIIASNENECVLSDDDNFKQKFYHYIGTFNQSPSFLKDNKFILNGYRINFHTPKSILKSLFMLHNELVNIWTHLIGALLIFFLVVYIAVYLQPKFPELKAEFQTKVNLYFSPIYEEIHNLENSLNQNTMQKVFEIKEDFSKYNENFNRKYDEMNDLMKEKFNSFMKEIQNFTDNFNKDTAEYTFSKMENKMREIGNKLNSAVNEVSQNIPEISSLRPSILNYSKIMLEKVEDTKNFLISKIDSEEYDFIDLYKLIDNSRNPYKSSLISRWPIFIFLLSAIMCLLFSSAFHLFCSMSFKICTKMQYLDYAGISLLISGSTFPPFVYGFYCNPMNYIIYESIICSACIVVFIVSLFETIHKPEYRKVKGILYGSLGIFAALPSIHLIFNEFNSIDDSFSFSTSYKYYLSVGFFYLSGLAIYVAQCPERFKPGRFDIWGSSHQLWHFSVLTAIIMTYFGSLEVFYSRRSAECYL